MQLAESLQAAGAKAVHLERALRVWLSGAPLSSSDLERLPFSETVRALLPWLDAELDGIARVVSEHPSEDGGLRLLLQLADGRSVESVLLPRGGVCVSTQVGCAVGCTFCMTGKLGLERQLTVDEMLAQVVAARRRRRVRRVVFMGMGEPAHNLDAVLETISKLGIQSDIAHKNLVFSTVGEARVFERLAAEEVKPALALSLHSIYRERREELLPRAPRAVPRELLESALSYSERSGHPLQLQWTLLAGVNDGDDELEGLIECLRGRRVVVNFIPYNRVEGLEHGRTSGDRAHVMTRRLHAAGIVAKLRQSTGQDVDAGCGQLRARLRPSSRLNPASVS